MKIKLKSSMTLKELDNLALEQYDGEYDYLNRPATFTYIEHSIMRRNIQDENYNGPDQYINTWYDNYGDPLYTIGVSWCFYTECYYLGDVPPPNPFIGIWMREFDNTKETLICDDDYQTNYWFYQPLFIVIKEDIPEDILGEEYTKLINHILRQNSKGEQRRYG